MLLLTMLSLATLVIAVSVGQIVACLTIGASTATGTAICSGMVPYSMVFGVLGLICIPVAISVHFEVKNRERRNDQYNAP